MAALPGSNITSVCECGRIVVQNLSNGPTASVKVSSQENNQTGYLCGFCGSDPKSIEKMQTKLNESAKETMRLRKLAFEAQAKVGLLRNRFQQLQFAEDFGCCTGDCPHESTQECLDGFREQMENISKFVRKSLLDEWNNKEWMRYRAYPSVFRCRGCGEYLGLDETHHGSHLKDTENGSVECGAIDEIESDDLLNELKHLHESREKQWGIADEAMMADIERRLWAAVDASCVGEELELKGECDCPAHMVLRRFEEIPKPIIKEKGKC